MGFAVVDQLDTAELVPEKKVAIPFQIGLERNPQLPHVPPSANSPRTTAPEIVKLFVAPHEMDRPMLTPPGVPAERVAALRAAFHAAMNDPGFIADAKKQHLDIQEVDGDSVAKIVERAYAQPADVVTAVHEAMGLTGTSGAK